MFESIKNEILEKIKAPNIIFEDVKNINIDDFLLDEYTKVMNIKFTKDELKEYLVNEDKFLSKANLDIINKIINKKISIADTKIDGINFKSLILLDKMIYINHYYLANCLNNNKEIEMILMDVDQHMNYQQIKVTPRLSLDNKIIDLYEKIDDIKNIEIEAKDIILSKFKNDIYEAEFMISQLKYNFNVLYTNLSYNIYKHQYLKKFIYLFDIKNKDFYIGDLSSSEFIKLFNDIKNNGIRTPIMMVNKRGFLYPPLLIDNVILFISRILKLNSIPVMIISSEINDEFEDHAINEILKSKKDELSDIFVNINEELYPYFILSKKDNSEKLYSSENVVLKSNYINTSNDELYDGNYELYSYKTDVNKIEEINSTYELEKNIIDEIDKFLNS